jgi:hypothetical protein
MICLPVTCYARKDSNHAMLPISFTASGLVRWEGEEDGIKPFLFAPDTSTRHLGDSRNSDLTVPHCARCLIEP